MTGYHGKPTIPRMILELLPDGWRADGSPWDGRICQSQNVIIWPGGWAKITRVVDRGIIIQRFDGPVEASSADMTATVRTYVEKLEADFGGNVSRAG